MKVQNMRYNTYTIVRASGDVERCKVPTFFDPYTVAKQLPHSLLFMDLPKGRSVWASAPERIGIDHFDALGTLYGPAVVLIHNEQYYWMPHAPKDDTDAGRLYRNYGPEIYAKAECRRQLATA